MKILLVNKFHWMKGGSETYYFGLGKMLKEHGHEVAYFSMKDDKNITTGDKEYFVEASDMNSKNITKAFDVIYNKKNKKKMEEALDDFKPDIVHLNNFQRQLSASIIEPCIKRHIPIVFTAHDAQAVCPAITMMDKNKNVCNKCLGGKYKNCIKNSCIKDSKLKSLLGSVEGNYYRNFNIYTKKINCIITPSEFLRKVFISDGISKEKIKAIHNFVDMKEYDITSELGDYALFVGRISKEKGIMNLLKAFKNVNGTLYIAGDGPEKDEVTKFIKENKMGKKVKLLGFINKQEVIDYVRSCRFVVLPSICNENCPYSIIEAITLGKPVVASAVGGIPELVIDNVNGFTYKYDDVDELIRKMNFMFENDDIIVKFSQDAKIKSNEYSVENYYKELLNIYNKIKETK